MAEALTPRKPERMPIHRRRDDAGPPWVQPPPLGLQFICSRYELPLDSTVLALAPLAACQAAPYRHAHLSAPSSPVESYLRNRQVPASSQNQVQVRLQLSEACMLSSAPASSTRFNSHENQCSSAQIPWQLTLVRSAPGVSVGVADGL